MKQENTADAITGTATRPREWGWYEDRKLSGVIVNECV